MPKYTTTRGAQDGDQVGLPLNGIKVPPPQKERRDSTAGSCCKDPHHWKLAICSIICGISCIGISALTNSVKAKQEADPEKAADFTKQAKKFGVISIALWVSVLVLTPILLVLVSYLITLGN